MYTYIYIYICLHTSTQVPRAQAAAARPRAGGPRRRWRRPRRRRLHPCRLTAARRVGGARPVRALSVRRTKSPESGFFWSPAGSVGIHPSCRAQINTPLKADHPERPTIILGWSLEHPLGILENNVSLC